EAGAEAQRVLPGVEWIDLVALDAADLEAEAVGAEVDGCEVGGGHWRLERSPLGLERELGGYVNAPNRAAAVPLAQSRPLSGSTLSTRRLALQLFNADVPHVLALDHVDHVLGHVLRMVADALDRLRHEEDLQAERDGAWVLHHESDELPRGGAEVRVDELVLADDG